MTKRNIFVFDADDTLWPLEWLYSLAYSKFFNHLYETLGDKMINLHSLQDKFFKFEEELYKEYGVREGRVGEAMVRTYRALCKFIFLRFHEEIYDEKQEEYFRKIGKIPFDYTKIKWWPEARETLSVLAERGEKLCLLSSYDKNIFPAKADCLNIYEFFPKENILLTETGKIQEDFIKVSGWTPEEDEKNIWYAVGNGESDIVPALEISPNWRGIFIPHASTSRFFKRKGELYNTFMPFPLSNDRIINIMNIGELLKAI